jgi:methionyl-tRNA formyltransferase
LIETLDGIETGKVSPIPQDNELATIARSLSRDAGAIDWRRTASEIVDLVRGCTPKPGAYSRMNGMVIKIWSANAIGDENAVGEPGEVVEINRDGIKVAAQGGYVLLREVQAESRQRMPAPDFVRGAGLKPADRFDEHIDTL